MLGYDRTHKSFVKASPSRMRLRTTTAQTRRASTSWRWPRPFPRVKRKGTPCLALISKWPHRRRLGKVACTARLGLTKGL